MVRLGALALLASLACAATFSSRPGETSAESQAAPAVAVERLKVHFGCEEMFVAQDPEGTLVVAVRVPGILERGRAASLPYLEELDVAGSKVAVRVEEGAHLYHWCTDVMDRPPRIDAAWTGISGTATVVLLERAERGGAAPPTPGRRPSPTDAVLRLGPTVLAREGGSEGRRILPPLEITATLGRPGGG